MYVYVLLKCIYINVVVLLQLLFTIFCNKYVYFCTYLGIFIFCSVEISPTENICILERNILLTSILFLYLHE